MDTEKILANIAKKGGIDMETLKAEYAVVLEKIPPGDKREEKALKELNKKYSIGRSPAVAFEGIIVGIGRKINFSQGRLKAAREAYAENSTDAITKGLVKEVNGEIVVIDNRAEFSGGQKNNNYGKPLLDSYNRSCIALIKNDSGAYALTTLDLRNKHANGDLPPLNTLLSFRALGDVEKGLRTSDAATTFTTQEIIDPDTVLSQLTTLGADHCKLLGDCMEYHRSLPEATPEFYNSCLLYTSPSPRD